MDSQFDVYSGGKHELKLQLQSWILTLENCMVDSLVLVTQVLLHT
jgi:hypothetical protein